MKTQGFLVLEDCAYTIMNMMLFFSTIPDNKIAVAQFWLIRFWFIRFALGWRVVSQRSTWYDVACLWPIWQKKETSFQAVRGPDEPVEHNFAILDSGLRTFKLNNLGLAKKKKKYIVTKLNTGCNSTTIFKMVRISSPSTASTSTTSTASYIMVKHQQGTF